MNACIGVSNPEQSVPIVAATKSDAVSSLLPDAEHSESGESSPLAWLIDQKWWNKWERVTKESNNNQSEINEVISTLKTLKHPENERLGIKGSLFYHFENQF